MKINSSNLNFSALLGKKEITLSNNSGRSYGKVVQHVYPFKDEFQSAEQKEELAKKVKTCSYLNHLAQKIFPHHPSALEKEVIIEKPLPFTLSDFIIAKQAPEADNVSQDALDFINSSDYGTMTIKRTGYFSPEIVR